MSPAERALLARIQSQAAELQPKAAERLLAAYDLIRASMTEAEILSALRTGSLDRMLSEALSDQSLDAAFSSLRAAIDRETLATSAQWYETLPSRVRVGASFDVLNPRVIEAVRALDTRVVNSLKDEVRESVRQAVREGLEAGKGPRKVAVRIRDAVGLSPRHERAVANFRAELEAGDRAALNRVLGRNIIRTPEGSDITRSGHAGGKGIGARDLASLEQKLGREELTPAKIERYVEQYRTRLHAVNTEAHSRSISLDSNRLAQRNSWQSAVDRGIADETRLQRTWVTVGDSRVRLEHRALNGQTVSWDGTYSNGDKVPGESDYGCRCIERITLSATPRAHAA